MAENWQPTVAELNAMRTDANARISIRAFGSVSYAHFIVTMALYCIISEIKRDIGLKKSRFFIPLHSTPSLGVNQSINQEFLKSLK